MYHLGDRGGRSRGRSGFRSNNQRDGRNFSGDEGRSAGGFGNRKRGFDFGGGRDSQQSDRDSQSYRRGGPSRGGARSGARGGARGPQRGGRPGLGAGNKVAVVPFERGNRIFENVFIVKGKADAIATKNLVPGESVYGEKRVDTTNEIGEKTEYRLWNVFRSKLGAAIVAGITNMPIKKGTRVLYLGAANGTTVSHVSDIVGETGAVFAVEFSPRSGRDLTNLAKRRPNIVPIIEDARMPWKYRMLVPMVDVIFSDVAQPDQARIVALNASYFLRTDGWFMISVKASCVDSTISPEAVYAAEIDALKKEKCKTKEQLSLEPYHRDHSMLVGVYRSTKTKTTT